MDGLQDDAAQALKAVRRLTEQGQDLMVVVRNEAGAFAQTSRRVRRKVVRGVDRVEEKLADLETLYDVVHGEVEDAALDVAADAPVGAPRQRHARPGPAPARGRPVMKLARLALAFAGVGLVLLALPASAHAWTPGTHIYLGESVLGQSRPAARRRRRPAPRLSRSTSSTATSRPTPRSRSTTRPSGRHCHYWHVGQEIHDLAATDALRAFGLGYLCHLAADTVAHNYFVPRQLMITSSTAAVGHSYWETRVETHLGTPTRARRRTSSG